MLSVADARVLIEDYRRHYNKERPHDGIGYRTPA
jgi:transposase InsO family protein